MKTVYSVIKNDFNRAIAYKSRFSLSFFLSICAIIVAIIVSQSGIQESLGTIAVVSSSNVGIESPYITTVYLEKIPPKSDLVLGKYSAIVFFDGEKIEIDTIKNKEYQENLLAFFEDPSAYSLKESTKRGMGSTIIGFLLMFVLLQGLSTMFLFSEDQKDRKIERIFSAPSSFSGYLFGQVVFNFLINFIPLFGIIFLLKCITHIPFGLTLSEYGFIVFFLCVLSSAFALFISSFIKNPDSANMIGSGIIIVTSVLAGGFYEFEQNNEALSAMIRFFPQKQILTVVSLLENHSGTYPILRTLFPVIIIIIFLFVVSTIKIKRDYSPKISKSKERRKNV